MLSRALWTTKDVSGMRVAPRRREHMLMLPRDSARCNILNILKQAAKWSSHFETGICREWADQWPIMHAGYQADISGVMAEHLCVVQPYMVSAFHDTNADVHIN